MLSSEEYLQLLPRTQVCFPEPILYLITVPPLLGDLMFFSVLCEHQNGMYVGHIPISRYNTHMHKIKIK